MEDFIEMNETLLEKYIDLSVGYPSHDTLKRVISMVHPQFLNDLKVEFEAYPESVAVKKLIAIDGKTMHENESKKQSPNHIVTAYAYDGGNLLSLSQVAVEEKSNEITAIPRLLHLIDIRQGIWYL